MMFTNSHWAKIKRTAGFLLGFLALASFVSCSDVNPGMNKDKKSSTNSTKEGENKGPPRIDLGEIDWKQVKFDFVTNKEIGGVAGDKLKLEIKAEAPDKTVLSLYYSDSFSSTANAVAIKENLPISTTSIEWNTTGVEPGTYFLFIVLRFGDKENLRFFGSSIAVDDPAGSNRSPFIAIDAQNGLENIAFREGEVIPLRFIAADPDENDKVSFQVEYTSDGGETWKPASDKLTTDDVTINEETGVVSYDITVPADWPQGTRYGIRVTGTDRKGLKGEGMTTVEWGIRDEDIRYTQVLRPMLISNCAMAGCHTNTDAKARLMLDYYDGRIRFNRQANFDGTVDERNDIMDRMARTGDGMMPPSGQLSQANRDLFKLWTWRQGPGNGARFSGNSRPGDGGNQGRNDDDTTNLVSFAVIPGGTQKDATTPTLSKTETTATDLVDVYWSIIDPDSTDVVIYTMEITGPEVGGSANPKNELRNVGSASTAQIDIKDFTPGDYSIIIIADDGRGLQNRTDDNRARITLTITPSGG